MCSPLAQLFESFFQVTKKSKDFFGVRSWVGSILDTSGRRGELGGILEVSGSHLGDIGEASGRLLGGFWEASGRLLGGIWEASGRPSGRHLRHLEAIWTKMDSGSESGATEHFA